MRVNVGPIKGRKGASLDLDFEERMPAPWDDHVDFVDAVTVSAKVTNTGRGFFVSGDARVQALITCDRCLETYATELAAQFEQEFRPATEPESRWAKPRVVDPPTSDAEETNDEDDHRTFDGETIDLDDTVGEAFLLSAPSKFICRDDCKGICPQCGANRNEQACKCENRTVDPRLMGLADLLDKGQD